MSERALRQQTRLLKAAKTGKELNDSYYDEVDSDNQQRNDDPYDINQRHGYESSSTAHKEVSKAATKLKKKVQSFNKSETITKGGIDEVEHARYVDPEQDETHALFKSAKKQHQ